MIRLWRLEACFPNLANAGYEKTSDETGLPSNPGSYNCISYAAQDPYNRWWWPDPDGYWPPWIKKQETVRCFVRTFRRLGYIVCKHSRPESGFDKVVLYAIHESMQPRNPPSHWKNMSEWIPTHMARQLADGTWTSKCGPLEDIRHLTLNALECHGPWAITGIAEYGQAILYMKRPTLLGHIARFVQRNAWKPLPPPSPAP